MSASLMSAYYPVHRHSLHEFNEFNDINLPHLTIPHIYSPQPTSLHLPVHNLLQVLLTGSSLVVCFWAEVFHLESIRWDRPR